MLKREFVVFEQLMEDQESAGPVSSGPYTEHTPKPEASSGLYAAVVDSLPSPAQEKRATADWCPGHVPFTPCRPWDRAQD